LVFWDCICRIIKSFSVVTGWDLSPEMVSAAVWSDPSVQQWLLGSCLCRLGCVEVRRIEIVFACNAD
jgi:hypothetical protein